MKALIICASLFAIDGDTVSCDGKHLRDMGSGVPFVSGFDAPEIFHPKCSYEHELGLRAKARYSWMLAQPGTYIMGTGVTDDPTGFLHRRVNPRQLVNVYMASGVALGDVLISEGLAHKWEPYYKSNWCN